MDMIFKKTVLFLGFMLLFWSCSSNDGKYSFEETVHNKFHNEFTTTFGKIDKAQDWGFSDTIRIFNYADTTLTKAANVNGNLWYQQWERPINVTDAEREKAIIEFSKTCESAIHTESISWENYWVQQVYKGSNPLTDEMNQLLAWNFNTNTFEHVNNFNYGDNTNIIRDGETNQEYIGTTLMVDMGNGSVENQFAYYNSSDSHYHYEYIILEIDGAYYLGFDVNGDYIFNDWIVKISPAKFNMNGAIRVIAEDLGDSKSDFDYNDVVFDVKVANEWNGVINQNRLVAYVVLQAAGGTLPLTIGGKEVHEAFGVSEKTMVNTGSCIKAPVEFKIDLGEANWGISGADAIKSIPIVVKNGENVIHLETETGQAPEKIAVPTNFKWTLERVPIQEEYPKFKEWIADKTIVWFNNEFH